MEKKMIWSSEMLYDDEAREKLFGKYACHYGK